MTHRLPLDRDPTPAEWQAILAALPPAPGPPLAAPPQGAGAGGVAGSPAPAADAPAPPAWLKFALDNPSPDEHEVTPEGVPVPHFTPWVPARARTRGWSAVTQRWFIAELTRIGSARAAAAAVGKSAQSAYALRAKLGAESFAAAWDAAVLAGHQAAEQTAIARALHGELVPAYTNGQFTGYSLRHNDRLLVAALGSSRSTGSRTGAGAGGLDEYRGMLERWEIALNRRMLDLGEGVYLPDERVTRAWDARQVWEREAARERDRLERRRVMAHAREVVRINEQHAAEDRAGLRSVGPRGRLP